MNISQRLRSGFTIVELLVVIVVIGILAAITLVSFNGIQQRAVGASLQSDLDSASKKLKLYQTDNGEYPTAFSDEDETGNYCPTPEDSRYCVKASADNTFDYNRPTADTFELSATHSTTTYSMTDDTSPVLVTISVPGAPTDIAFNDDCATPRVSWLAPEDDGGSEITGYNIYRSASEGGTYEFERSVSGSPSAVGYNWWYYKVAAVNEAGIGAMTNDAVQVEVCE